MENLINLKYVVNSLLFSFIGLGVYGAGFYLFDKVTPYHLWKEVIEEHNTSLAIVVGAMSIGIALIIAAAIHA
ncbi:MAG: DUF350 domain-containing protein [Methylotenera sp.]|nr:DUF350 domain-containing protein [Oligoflexia bacterium]